MKAPQNSSKIIIVEFGCWHDECLYTTCLLLKRNGYHITLALNSRLKERIEHSLDIVSDKIVYYPFDQGIKGVVSLFHFYSYLLHSSVNNLYLNSAQGGIAWKFFLFPLPRRINIVGTLHFIKKLKNSIGQRLITNRINKYVLLSDLLLNEYKKVSIKPVTAVYPIFYPPIPTIELKKPKEEVWIIIPGAVSFSRRDYKALIPKNGEKYKAHIKFIILGNIHKADGQNIQYIIKEHKIEKNFIFFNQFVPEEIFYSYICQGDYIMPLIHPHKTVYAKYLTEKISGTYNLAIAFQKPMLCPTEMNKYEDFKDSSFFYPIKNLIPFINNLKKHPDTSKLFQLSKWSLERQQERIIQLFLSKMDSYCNP